MCNDIIPVVSQPVGDTDEMLEMGVKPEHQLPDDLLKLISVPIWKWECIICDFVSGLPKSLRKK